MTTTSVSRAADDESVGAAVVVVAGRGTAERLLWLLRVADDVVEGFDRGEEAVEEERSGVDGRPPDIGTTGTGPPAMTARGQAASADRPVPSGSVCRGGGVAAVVAAPWSDSCG